MSGSSEGHDQAAPHWKAAVAPRSARILVVDDDPAQCRLLERVLSARGHEILTAATVAEAIERSDHPELAIVDLRLPDGTGTDLLVALRDRDPDLPVIVFTGYGSVDSAVEAVNRGATAYFLKPLILDELVAAVEQQLEKRQLVSENRRLEADLRRELAEKEKAVAERSLHRAAIEAVAEAIVVTDSRGRVEYVNPAFETITGYSFEEISEIGLHVLDSGHHDEGFFEVMREALRIRGTWSGDLVSRRRDGTILHESSTISTIVDDNGVVRGYAHVGRDVTEERRLRTVAEAMSTTDSLGYVFSGIRHEIGNPINSATFALKTIIAQLKTLEPESIEDYLERTLGELGKVTKLLGLLKSFEAFEAADVAPLELQSFLAGFVALSRPDCARRGVEIHLGPPAELDTVSADPRALQQVLLGVLTNALDACEGLETGEVTIAARREGSEVAVTVADNGSGMTDERLRSLFRPFATTKEGHIGLGLVVCRRLMSQMDGSIDVASASGRGTTVTLRLPAA